MRAAGNWNLWLPRLWAQVVKEFICILRDARTRRMLIGPPLLQLLVFSYAITLDVTNVTVGMLDRDGGPAAQALLADLSASRWVGRLLPADSPQQLDDLVNSREALIALHIPAGFSRQVAAGRSAEIQVIVDGRRAHSGQTALAHVQSTAARIGRKQPLQPVEAIAVRHWFNPNLDQQWFVVPSLAGLMAMFIALIVTALSIARERELGTFDQLLVSPCTAFEIVVAKTVPAACIGTALGSVMVLAAIFGFGVPFTGSLPMLTLAIALFILAVAGVGLMVSALSQTQQQAILGSFALAVPMVLMSGFATPVENMPFGLQIVAEAMPLKHFLLLLHACFLKSLSWEGAWRHLWPLALIGFTTLAAATAVVHVRLR